MSLSGRNPAQTTANISANPLFLLDVIYLTANDEAMPAYSTRLAGSIEDKALG